MSNPRAQLQARLGRKVLDSTRGAGDVYWQEASGPVYHSWSDQELQQVQAWAAGLAGPPSPRTRILAQLSAHWPPAESGSADLRPFLVLLERVQNAAGTPRYAKLLEQAQQEFSAFYERTPLAGRRRDLLHGAWSLSRALDGLASIAPGISNL